MDFCDGLWGCCWGEETQSCQVRVEKQEGIVCTGRGQLVTSMEGERRGYEVQLAAVMVCVFSPEQGCCQLCATHWLGFVAAAQQPPTTSCVASGCC